MCGAISGSGLPQGREPPLPHLPLRTGGGSCGPGPVTQADSAFLTGLQNWGEGNETQVLEGAGGLYLDFLGLSGEIFIFSF